MPGIVTSTLCVVPSKFNLFIAEFQLSLCRWLGLLMAPWSIMRRFRGCGFPSANSVEDTCDVGDSSWSFSHFHSSALWSITVTDSLKRAFLLLDIHVDNCAAMASTWPCIKNAHLSHRDAAHCARRASGCLATSLRNPAPVPCVSEI